MKFLKYLSLSIISLNILAFLFVALKYPETLIYISKTAAVGDIQICEPNTYYIDYVGGNDANNGTCTISAWKHHPYMNNATGTAKAYAHQSGDLFIFKGGVTWKNEAFPLYVSDPYMGHHGGTVGNPDYYGVDKTWYTGGGWSRPVFDLEGIAMTDTTSQVPILLESTSDITIDNIEIKNQLITQGKEFGRGGILISSSDNILIENVYIHDWIIDTTVDSKFGGIICSTCANLTIDSSTIHGSEVPGHSGEYSGAGFYQNSANAVLPGTVMISNSEIYYVSQGIFGADVVYGSNIHNIGDVSTDTWSSDTHGNAVWLDPGAIFYNNIVHDIGGAEVVYPIPGVPPKTGPIYVYNNIVYNTTLFPLTIDSNHATAGADMKVYIYNNTFDGEISAVLRPVDPINTVSVKNNLIIYDGLESDAIVFDQPVINDIRENNKVITSAQASTLGLTVANLFKPSSALTGITNAGQAITCANCPNINKDILGTTRPQGSAWDIGAYEYTGTVTPTNCASFTYTAWSPATCPESETQTRTVVTSSPDGCTGGSPVLSQSCTYIPPSEPCTDHNYSDWSACVDNTQSHTLLTSYPVNCVGGEAPVLTQACTNAIPACTYGDATWSTCLNSSQTRTRNATNQPCTGTATLTEIQSCSSPRPTGGGSSGGGGYTPPPVTPVITATTSTSSTTLPVPIQIPTTATPVTPPFLFTRILNPGYSGEDVRQLQIFLNTHGAIIATTGIGSPGHEDSNLSPAVTQALIRFQNAHYTEILKPAGVTQGTGVFGLGTMKYVNDLLKASTPTRTVTPAVSTGMSICQFIDLLVVIDVVPQTKATAAKGMFGCR